jgi:hypothetical protein
MKKKSIVIAMMLALALPISTFAQGGLFQRGDGNELYYGQTDVANQSLLLRDGEAMGSLSNQGFGNPIGGSDLTNQTFGAPLGSGLFVLLLAGAGYFVLKSNKKND